MAKNVKEISKILRTIKIDNRSLFNIVAYKKMVADIIEPVGLTQEEAFRGLVYIEQERIRAEERRLKKIKNLTLVEKTAIEQRIRSAEWHLENAKKDLATYIKNEGRTNAQIHKANRELAVAFQRLRDEGKRVTQKNVRTFITKDIDELIVLFTSGKVSLSYFKQVNELLEKYCLPTLGDVADDFYIALSNHSSKQYNSKETVEAWATIYIASEIYNNDFQKVVKKSEYKGEKGKIVMDDEDYTKLYDMLNQIINLV